MDTKYGERGDMERSKERTVKAMLTLENMDTKTSFSSQLQIRELYEQAKAS
jgi:hypothetical protein